MNRQWTRRRGGCHLVAWLVAAAVFRFGLVPPETCPPVSIERVDLAVEAAAGWAIDNLGPDGRFLYAYDRTTETVSGDYNLPRHAGMTNALFQAVVADRPHLLSGADASLEYMLDNLLEHDDWVAFAVSGRPVKVGSTGLFVAALVHRRQATGDTRHDAMIEAGARFLTYQQESDGAVLGFWSRSDETPIPDRYGPFATGEAMWGLALAGTVFPDAGFTEAARLTGAYIATDRRSNEGLMFRLPDHWAAYGFDTLGGPATPAETEYLERLAGEFALMTRVESTRADNGLQGTLRFGHALGAGLGALGEGVSGMYRMSARGVVLEQDQASLAGHLACIGSMLVDRQVSAGDAVDSPHPEFVVGAWFRDDRTQVDDQQHTLSSLLTVREAMAWLEREPA